MIFSQHEWLQIASLLKKGYAIQQILYLLKKQQSFSLVYKKYENYEQALLSCSKGRFQKHLLFFVQIQALQDAIYSAYEMCSFEQNLARDLYKKAMYPTLIFLLSFATIFTFSNYVLPQLLQQFSQYENTGLVLLLYTVKIMSAFVFIMFICLLLTIVFIMKTKHLNRLFYKRFAYRIPLVREYISYYLSGYFLQLHLRGLSSKQSFQFLLGIQNSYLKKTILLINEQVAKGVDLNECLQTCSYLSEVFQSYYLIGSHNGDLNSALVAFMDWQQQRWFRLIHKISVGVQLLSYAFVGVLVISVYQIMLLPLQMINEL